MGAVLERMPVGLDLQADLELLGLAVDDVGDEVAADVERDAHDGIGLGAAERRRAALRDGVGEHLALARHLAPFDVAPPSGEDADRPREVLIFSGRLAVLHEQLLLLRPFPIGLGEVEVLDRALDAQRVVECFGHYRPLHSWSHFLTENRYPLFRKMLLIPGPAPGPRSSPSC